jgi:hypothetical protein
MRIDSLYDFIAFLLGNATAEARYLTNVPLG